MDPQELKIYQTGKAQGKSDAFIKNAILAYRATKPAPVDHLNGFSVIANKPTAIAGTPSPSLTTNKGPLGNFIANVSDGMKKAASFFTTSEQAVGGELASGLPASVTGEATLNAANEGNAASDVAYIKAINAKKAAGQKLTVSQQELYDHILQTHSQIASQTDLLPHAADTNAQALGNVAGVAADVLGAGTYGKAAKTAETGVLLRKTAPSVVTKTADAASALKAAVTTTPEQAAAKQVARIADVVAPKMTAKETAAALTARGGTKTGILGSIKANADPAVQRIAQTVQKYVPNFSAKKTLVENINATKSAVSNLASDLKDKVVASGKDRIYSFKELGATLNGLEKPTLLVGDLDKAYGNVVNKAMQIARSNGGKVSDLFQARKEFDDFVSKEFPNLYSSDTLTPMRTAIKNVRNALTDFTAEHLPNDVGLRDSLTIQSRLLEAVENMSEKAASGAEKEVGTNVVQRTGRFLRKYPAVGGALGIAGYEEAKKLPVIGGLLP